MTDVWSDNPLGLDGSRVIDRKIYVDPDVFEAEREKIFASTWQWVAHESELPEFGNYVTASVAGRPIVVVRGEGGKINAFFNACTHRGAIVAAGPRGQSDGSFVCFYHAWCFDTEGKLTGVPLAAAYGDHLKKACYDLPRVRAESFAGNVFVTLDPDIEPLADFLAETGPYIEEFTGRHEALGRVRWRVKGNWKLWHENFRDNYHPMYTHALIGANYQGVKIEGRNFALSKGHSVMIFPCRATRPRSSRRSAGSPAITSSRGRSTPGPRARGLTNHIMAVFPNLDFQAGGDHTILQTVRPIDAENAVVELVAFGVKGEPDEVRRNKLATALDIQTSAGKISGDDAEAARRCAVGFGAFKEARWSNMDRGQAPGGEGAKNDEYSLRAFYLEYKRRLGDDLQAG